MQSCFVDPADLAACRTLLRGGSKSFFAASLLLPRRVQVRATALYAFCRVADDAIDFGDDPAAALALLHARVDAAYAGAPWPHPVDRAFAVTVRDCEIPKALPMALLEGFAWDAARRRYETFEGLLDYAARVAGVVGVMMALVMGVRDPVGLARAADLGVAMQLTNIARDVGEDAAAGRLYLPLDWLAAAGANAEDLIFSPGLAAVVKRLLDEAALLYGRGQAGIGILPFDCRAAIAAARRIYRAIGREVAKAGYDSVSARARVGGRQKLGLAVFALFDTIRKSADVAAPALPANQFLLNAVPDVFGLLPARPSGFMGLLTMFERLERSQRGIPAVTPAWPG